MRLDRDLRALTLIRPRKLPAIVLSAVLALPLVCLLALRRDVVVWLGEPVWVALATIAAIAFSLAAIRLFNPEPLMRVTPDGVDVPKTLASPIRWADIARIQATTRRGTTGDVHDRLIIHFKQPQTVKWRSPKLNKLFGDTPQAAVAVDIGMIWPLRADDVKSAIRSAARMYADAPAVQSDMSAHGRVRRRFARAAILLAAAAAPLGLHIADIGLPRQFSQGLMLYRNGDVGAAVPYLENDARAGDSEAAFALATLYLNGDGVTRNTAMAAGWFRRAADAGHADAAYNLGNAYRLGLGTPKDINRALDWYTRAADDGSMVAAFTLGKIYRLGDGVRRDYRLAINWLRVAADGAYAPAEHDLGQLYQEGIAVPRDLGTAQTWYSRAAARGHAPARFDLARLLLDGDTKQRSVGLAALIQAAETGYAPAQRRLAAVYFNGHGLERDSIAAFKWISLAERSWPAASRADLVREKARIAAALNAEELALSKLQIRAWRPVKDHNALN
jgi:TPR repeat protein